MGDRWKTLSRAQKAAAAGVSAAGLALVGWFVNWSMPQVVDWIHPPFEAPVSSRLLIVDTSASMAGALGREKFKAAVAEIESYAENSPDVALALRTAGGKCSGGYREPPVEFGSDNADAIRSELRDARLGGESNIVSQLEQANNDFQKFRLARSSRIQTIWLFLGTARDCRAKNIPLGEAIEAVLEGSPAKLSNVDLFVLRGDKASYQNLEQAVEGLGARFLVMRAGTPRQLKRAVQQTSQREEPSD